MCGVEFVSFGTDDDCEVRVYFTGSAVKFVLHCRARAVIDTFRFAYLGRPEGMGRILDNAYQNEPAS